MEARPNFYRILELDGKLSNWSDIEAVILDKQREWGKHKNQGTPKQKLKAERYLKLLPEIKTLLKDPEARAQELKAFEQEKREEKDASYKKLDDLIADIQNSAVTNAVVDSLVSATQKAFNRDEVVSRLTSKGISVENFMGQKEKSNTSKKLDASTANRVRNELETFHLSDLYEFLNLEHSPELNMRSSCKSLQERADHIYKTHSRIGKTDPDTTLKMSLAGHAISMFASDDNKALYDASLAKDGLKQLDDYIDVAGANGLIEQKSYETLLARGKSFGFNPIIVAEYVEEYAKKKKWIISSDKNIDRPPLKVCGYCSTIASSSSDTRCRNCGQELVQPCPKCNAPTPTENIACPQCGCHIGDARLVNALLKESRSLEHAGKLDDAANQLRSALSYWDNWTPALEALKRIEALLEQSQQALTTIDYSIMAREFLAADTQLRKYQRTFGKYQTKTLERTISTALTKTKCAYEAGELFLKSSKNEQAYTKFNEAIGYCADFKPAINAIQNIPPPAPRSIKSRVIEKTAHVEWDTVNAAGKISYTIVRKNNHHPKTPEDGVVLTSEFTASSFEDPSMIPGQVYYYAVFSSRSGVLSKTAAFSKPQMYLAEVEHVNCETGNQQVTVNWKTPAGCTGVEVWRQNSSAPNRPEGKRISTNANSFLDRDLVNGNRYGYLILCKYRDPSDEHQEVYSKGVSITAVPILPPPVIEDLTARKTNDNINLHWSAPAKDVSVQIYMTQSMPDYALGQVIQLADAGKLGSPIPCTARDSAQARLKSQGRVFFVPLSIRSESGVVGKAVEVTSINDVSNLASQCSGSSIFLTWDWPQGAREVLVAYDYNEFPTASNTSGAGHLRVTREDYEYKNHCELRSIARKKHFFTIFVKDPYSNVCSAGKQILEAMGKEYKVRYQLNIDKTLLSRRIVSAEVEFKGDLSDNHDTLPAVVVVLKKSNPPLSQKDGVVIAQTETLQFLNGEASVSIPNEHINSRGYIKVFFTDPAVAKDIRLLPAKSNLLKLG